MDDDSVERMLERERLQMEQIRELDMEELQIEEVDDDHSSDDDVLISGRGDGGAGPSGGFTFNTCLASLHTYLGEVDDTHGRLSFLDGGAILNLPMFYLEGVVLFPEATLPLRVIQPRFIAAVEKALNQVDAPFTIGVVRVHRHPDDGRLRFASVGTTAEIRQYRRLDDGSLNVVTRGQQRFRLRRRWIDVEGAPCGEVQIVQEDTPLRTPKDAFAQLASVSNFRKCSFSHAALLGASPAKRRACVDIDNDWERMSAASIVSDHSATDSSDSPHRYGVDESLSGDEDFMDGWDQRRRKFHSEGFSRSDQVHKCVKFDEDDNLGWDSVEDFASGKRSGDWEIRERHRAVHEKKSVFCAPLSFWPHWVYQMYDSYALARRAADLWKQVIGSPNMDDYIRKPDLLSFYIASKLPMSESTRQELLEIDGISYRLRREIQLLKGFNLIRCKNCLTLIAKRSDMVVMSSDGPLNAYVNPHGYVHEIITVYNANGLALLGSPAKEHSWFPGYAWTITNCAVCESNMGWLFTATKRNLLPKSFWGIRSSQVTDDTQ
ncbi:uncharacterized protein [Elaeis guineensis]|uniref:Protein cereblon n=1 Tax=Elaeis guineensis var. tenera TaxID=51953 RepID=A0A6I9QU87_ELAGV|nr:uncharacterized protein LOC105040528 isoform X2 [Elaeis guineensis]